LTRLTFGVLHALICTSISG